MVQKFVPRDRREMKTFEDIIKNAIGFVKARGDQVTVSNISFALQKEEVSFAERKPSWLDYVNTYLAVWVTDYPRGDNLCGRFVAPPGHKLF